MSVVRKLRQRRLRLRKINHSKEALEGVLLASRHSRIGIGPYNNQLFNELYYLVNLARKAPQ